MEILVDTHAWIEFGNGTEKGLLLKKYIDDSKNGIFTLECCLGELRGFCLKNNLEFEEFLSIVQLNSAVLEVRLQDWLEAASFRHELRKTRPGFGLIDALLLAKQKQLDCKLISGDHHFKGLKDVIFLE